MSIPRSFLSVALAACGAVALSASSAALAQGFGSRYGGGVEYDVEAYGAPVPPRPIPDYRPQAVETVVTTTRRVVIRRPADPLYGEPDAGIVERRVVLPAPVRRGLAAEVVVTTGSLPPRPHRPRYPVYASEPAYHAPAPAWREEAWREEDIAARPRLAAPPIVIEERRVETTRRILAPGPLD